MADAATRPQIVANLVPNQWSTIHLDINVENTGNATAFDIELAFTPALEKEGGAPFHTISLLKPGQMIQSYLHEIEGYLEKNFSVEISWKRHPDDTKREYLSYSFCMSDYSGVGFLNTRDPAVMMALELEKVRKSWDAIVKGSARLRVETYDTDDRKVEQDALEERLRQIKERRAAEQA